MHAECHQDKASLAASPTIRAHTTLQGRQGLPREASRRTALDATVSISMPTACLPLPRPTHIRGRVVGLAKKTLQCSNSLSSNLHLINTSHNARLHRWENIQQRENALVYCSCRTQYHPSAPGCQLCASLRLRRIGCSVHLYRQGAELACCVLGVGVSWAAHTPGHHHLVVLVLNKVAECVCGGGGGGQQGERQTKRWSVCQGMEGLSGNGFTQRWSR